MTVIVFSDHTPKELKGNGQQKIDKHISDKLQLAEELKNTDCDLVILEMMPRRRLYNVMRLIRSISPQTAVVTATEETIRGKEKNTSPSLLQMIDHQTA